jgi:SAM-dependent methyltransferase
MDIKDEITLLAEINKYSWYHRIQVSPTVYTKSTENIGTGCQKLWDFILRELNGLDFTGKRVLDIGCRDGLWSFEAEKLGAKEIVGIDNDLSLGAVEFLIPLFNSKVKMHELNLYDLTPERFGFFDIIIFPGVLYHLRYPFWGLKRITDCLGDKGVLFIESGMLSDEKLKDKDILFCPVEKSPYEPTSCTFFNEKGLTTTLRSLNCRMLYSKLLGSESPMEQSPSRGRSFRSLIKRWLEQTGYTVQRKGEGFSLMIDRQILVFEKDMRIWSAESSAFLDAYWNGNHRVHSCAEERSKVLEAFSRSRNSV